MRAGNKTQFYIGLILALGSATLTYLRLLNTTTNTVILIIGIGLMATSNYRLLK